MTRNLYFLPDALAALHREFLPYEIEGRFMTANDMRDLNDYLKRLHWIALNQSHELSRLLWNEQARQDRQQSDRSIERDNVVVFPIHNNPPHNGAA